MALLVRVTINLRDSKIKIDIYTSSLSMEGESTVLALLVCLYIARVLINL